MAFLPHSSSPTFSSSKLVGLYHDVLHEPISPENLQCPIEVMEKCALYKGPEQHLCFWEPLPPRTIISPVWCRISLKLFYLEHSMETPCQSPSSCAFCSENQQASKGSLKRGHICTEFTFIPTRVPKQCQCQPEVYWIVWEPKPFFAFCSSTKTSWVKIKRIGVGALGTCGFSQMPEAKY